MRTNLRSQTRSVSIRVGKRSRPARAADGTERAVISDTDSAHSGSDVASLVSRAETGVESELDGFEQELPAEPEDNAGPEPQDAAGHVAGDPDHVARAGPDAPAHDPDELLAAELRERAGRGQNTIWP